MSYDLPEDVIPFSAAVDPAEVIGKIARTNITCGQAGAYNHVDR